MPKPEYVVENEIHKILWKLLETTGSPNPDQK